MRMQLTEPVEVFPHCRLWLVYFNPESDEAASNQSTGLVEAKLSSRDLLRWKQFRPETKKQQFLASRLAVRAVLKRELGADADLVQFDSDSKGRPVLQSEGMNHGLQISLSHSKNAVAIAISNGEFPIGVDFEIEGPLRTDALRLIATQPHEGIWCDQWIGRESEALLTLWTVKEAVWKSLHGSIGISISDISVDLKHGVFIPRVSTLMHKDDRFRTQPFVVQCEPIASGTLSLPPHKYAMTGIRGCIVEQITQVGSVR